MNRIEGLLREAYQEAADTIRAETVRETVPRPATGHLRRRFTAFAPLTAAVAVIVAIAAAVAIPRLVASHGATGYPASSVPPPFVVQLPYDGAGTAKLVVQAAGTRHVTGTLSPPAGTRWAAVTATGNSTTFVAAATNERRCVTSLYGITLSGDGRPLASRLRYTPTISGQLDDPTALAASADGKTIAYATHPCQTAKPGHVLGVARLGGLPALLAVPTSADYTSLSLSADGTLLGYARSASPTTTGGGAGTLPARSLSGAQPLDGGHAAVTAAALGPDGRTVYAITAASTSGNRAGGPPYTVSLGTYRASDGKLVRTLHTWQNIPVLLSPHLTIGGGNLLVWGITQPSTVEVDPVTGKLTSFWMYAPDGEFPVSVAW